MFTKIHTENKVRYFYLPVFRFISNNGNMIDVQYILQQLFLNENNKYTQ